MKMFCQSEYSKECVVIELERKFKIVLEKDQGEYCPIEKPH